MASITIKRINNVKSVNRQAFSKDDKLNVQRRYISMNFREGVFWKVKVVWRVHTTEVERNIVTQSQNVNQGNISII